MENQKSLQKTNGVFSISEILAAEKKQKESEAVKNRKKKPIIIPKTKSHA